MSTWTKRDASAGFVANLFLNPAQPLSGAHARADVRRVADALQQAAACRHDARPDAQLERYPCRCSAIGVLEVAVLIVVDEAERCPVLGATLLFGPHRAELRLDAPEENAAWAGHPPGGSDCAVHARENAGGRSFVRGCADRRDPQRNR